MIKFLIQRDLPLQIFYNKFQILPKTNKSQLDQNYVQIQRNLHFCLNFTCNIYSTAISYMVFF